MALSQPRQEESSSSSSGSDEEPGDVDEELEQLDSPAARMYHKSMVFQQDQKRIREEVTKHKRSTFRIPVGHCAQFLTSVAAGRQLAGPQCTFCNRSQGEGGCLDHSFMTNVKCCVGRSRCFSCFQSGSVLLVCWALLQRTCIAFSQVWWCWIMVVFDAAVWFVPAAHPLYLQTRCVSAFESAALLLACVLHLLADHGNFSFSSLRLSFHRYVATKPACTAKCCWTALSQVLSWALRYLAAIFASPPPPPTSPQYRQHHHRL